MWILYHPVTPVLIISVNGFDIPQYLRNKVILDAK